jgi:murein DD-endopeptidase MepM/ murein hydrolase activator NlpD
MDIINPGGTPVYSTVEGEVIYSGWDNGDPTRTCQDYIDPVPPLKKCAVGGAVVIKSKEGNYIVSFLHLRAGGLASGNITRGQLIGYIYDSPLPTSDQPHVHYQILLNGDNQPFGGSGGKCSEGKLLPSEPAPNKIVEASTVCD